MGNEGGLKKEGRLSVEEWPLDRVKPYERNPRKISDAAVAKVAASLREFGPRQPMVVDEDGVLIVGHTRLLAAQSLGWATYPVHQAFGMTDDQKRRYRIADNRTGEEAEWDWERLLGEINMMSVDDLPSLGFDLPELETIRAKGQTKLGDPEAEPPPPPKVPVTRPGDIWLLGATVVCPKCGKSTPAGRAKIIGEAWTRDE